MNAPRCERILSNHPGPSATNWQCGQPATHVQRFRSGEERDLCADCAAAAIRLMGTKAGVLPILTPEMTA